MFAGLIVMAIGLAVALARSFDIPGHWTPVIVGGALFLIGAARSTVAGRGEGDRS
jgi:hypothetical protein